MQLLTLREMTFIEKPNGAAKDVKSRTVGVATALPLVDALARIEAYRLAFYHRWAPRMIIEFALLGISPLEGLTLATPDLEQILRNVDVALVESLPQTVEELR